MGTMTKYLRGELMDSGLIYFVGVVFASFFIYSFAGFGAGLVGIPLLLMFMEVKVAVPSFIALVLINGLFLAHEGRGHIQWKHVRRLLAGGLIGVPIGVLCLKYLPTKAIALGINIFVFTFACLYSFGIKFRLEKEHPVMESVTGLISGVLSGSSGVGGPPVVMYGVLRDWRKDMFRSTMLVYFVGLGLWTNTSFLLMKMHSMETGRMVLIALIPSLLASWIGVGVKRKADERLFRRVVLIVIMITSLAGVGRYLFR